MTCGEWYSGVDVKAGTEVGRHSWFAVSFWRNLRLMIECLCFVCGERVDAVGAGGGLAFGLLLWLWAGEA